jgi:di- and tripeptidase
VYSLDTYERRKVVEAHRGSVLGLCLSKDQALLFSSATDPIVNVSSGQRLSYTHSLPARSGPQPHFSGSTQCGQRMMLATSFASPTPRTTIPYTWGRKTRAYRCAYCDTPRSWQDTDLWQWYDLKEKDARPRPLLASHPSERKDRFFDSTGPGGVRTPRPAGAESKRRHAVGGQDLEIDKQDIHQFAHYGYVYCMLLGTGILPEAPTEEILVSGGGDGRIMLWRIDGKSRGGITELGTLEDGRDEGESILSLAHEGSFLYSGRLNGEVNVWDLETRQLVRSLKASTGDVLCLSLGAGYLFAGGVEGQVQVGYPTRDNCIGLTNPEIQPTLRDRLHLRSP